MAGRIFMVLAALMLTSGCVKLTMAWADLTPDRPAASPPVLAENLDDASEDLQSVWKAERESVLGALQQHVYGTLPDSSTSKIIEKRVVDPAYLDGAAQLEEWLIEVTADFGGEVSAPQQFHLAVMLPAGAGPFPVIVMETFCRNHNTFPNTDLSRPESESMCDGDGVMSGIMTYVFGRYISTPPTRMIANHGYALAALHPGDVVPDSEGPGLRALAVMSEGYPDDETRWGAIAAWGWLYSRVVDVLEEDERFDPDAYIAWGHSRYGKSALVAAASDRRVNAVISHQSGAGGASLSRNKKGETIADITSSYPHWFSRSYAGYAGCAEQLPIDQHHLLALIAPRPVFLGNARRDVWSDPAGSFLAAEGADPVYEIFGSKGLEQEDLRDFRPEADISFFIRPGTHGITEEDWPAFLSFLDAHFATGPGALKTGR